MSRAHLLFLALFLKTKLVTGERNRFTTECFMLIRSQTLRAVAGFEFTRACASSRMRAKKILMVFLEGRYLLSRSS